MLIRCLILRRLYLFIASVYGLQKGLALLLLCMGFQESLRAKGYYDNTQKNGLLPLSSLESLYAFVDSFL